MLTDKSLRACRPRERPYKRADEKGLYVIVRPDGSKWWRFKYRIEGREKLLSLGVYPDASLKKARARRDAARQLLADGIDPSAQRRAEKDARADTFEAVATEYLTQREKPRKNSKRAALSGATIAKARWMLETFLYPRLGNRPIRSITWDDLLPVLRQIESRGIHETAHRAKWLCGQIFRYADDAGLNVVDITAGRRGALAPVVTENHAAIIEPAKVGALLRAIDGYRGQPSTTYALRLAPLVFVRPGELRGAEWSEFNLDAAEWRIPSERMKMRERHIVPLSRQALAFLEELRPWTGVGRLLFPSLRTSSRPISENTLNAALRRLGYSKEEQTTHGFRTIASTLLNELGWHPDLIERQLAHAPRDKVRASYDKSEKLPKRRRMMQQWADYLDSLKSELRTEG